MLIRRVAFPLLVLALSISELGGCAESVEESQRKEAERAAIAQIRITNNLEAVRGCTAIGLVSDDSYKDMQKKVLKMGGDTAVLMNQQLGKSSIWDPGPMRYYMTAEVYRCR